LNRKASIALGIGAILTTALCIGACGGGGTKPPKGEPPKTPTLAQQIDTLEKNGKLDRSSGLKGPDRDNNGIRDDIDAWIAAQSITELQKKLLNRRPE